VAVAAGALEEVAMNAAFWRGKRVLLTGHTGFKGAWLALWLADLGAEVHGLALRPPTEPNLFGQARVGDRLASSSIGDIRVPSAVEAAVRLAQPEIVFHLAAQSLVRSSYQDPVGTYATNVLGTAHVLEALRSSRSLRAVVSVTTDKCYENDGHGRPYAEDAPLGGYDPYSSSKACAELVTAAYRRSFLSEHGVGVATARAGNVIGGGDWATDRLVPDFLRSLDRHAELVVRSPEATRPWQHVLEPLSGYALLAEQLFERPAEFDGPWNFGPPLSDARPVRWVVDRLCSAVPGARWRVDQGTHPHEAKALSLDSTKATERLGWRPRWDLGQALDQTLAWHRAWIDGEDMQRRCLMQISEHRGGR
jgi:CDP-glucose 4,6-dehydratase